MQAVQWACNDTISLSYRLDGAGARSLIAIHEMGGSLISFAHVVPLLSDAYRILRYDQRGAGLSEKAPEQFSFDAHIDDLERVIDAAGLEPPFYLAGLAAGAAIAVAFADRHPKDVAALALCAPALGVSPERKAYLVQRTMLAAREGMREVENETLLRSYPVRYRERDPARFAAYRAAFLANDPVSYGLINMAFADVDVEKAVSALPMPCLLLAGEHDLLRPVDQVRALVPRFVDARCETIDSGHIMPVQSPDAMVGAIRFFFDAVAQDSFSKVAKT